MEEIRFQESRRGLPGWAAAILFLGGAVIGLLPSLAGDAEPRPALVGMLVIWALFFILRITVEVMSTGVRIAYRPFPTRRIAATEIEDVEVIAHRPLREYRDWGIRYSRKRNGWAYTVRGNRGVLITLTSEGKTVLVDGDSPELLEQAIRSILPGSRP